MSLLLLACTLLPVTLDSPPPTTQGAVVEVRKGRAVLLAGGAERTVRPDKPLTADGKAHLEVGAGTEVRVNWPGRASMHVWGPASVEWSPEGKPTRDRMEDTFTTHGLMFRFLDLAWADLEIRRGVHTLHLPGSWRAKVESGAFYLRGLPTGPTEIRHHAGSPVALEWIGDPSRARPPVRVYAGSSVVLDRPATGSGTRQSGTEEAWERPSWPWRRPVDTDEQASLQRQGAAEEWQSREARRGGVARIREFDDQPVRVEVQPMEAEPVRPVREPTILPRQTEAPVDYDTTRGTEREPMGTTRLETLGATVEDYRFQSDQWHGVARDEMTRAGQIVIQRAAGVDVRVFPSGRRKVFLDSTAPGPIWCFGVETDYRLHPGAVAVFETNGNLRMKFGTIEVVPAPSGRPEFADLQ